MLRADWLTYNGEKAESWSEKSRKTGVLIEALLLSLVQHTNEGHFGPSTT